MVGLAFIVWRELESSYLGGCKSQGMNGKRGWWVQRDSMYELRKFEQQSPCKSQRVKGENFLQ